jgi:hypothetical protein
MKVPARPEFHLDMEKAARHALKLLPGRLWDDLAVALFPYELTPYFKELSALNLYAFVQNHTILAYHPSGAIEFSLDAIDIPGKPSLGPQIVAAARTLHGLLEKHKDLEERSERLEDYKCSNVYPLHVAVSNYLSRCSDPSPSGKPFVPEGWSIVGARGPRPHTRRRLLITRTMADLEHFGIELCVSDQGVLAEVLRVLLGYADALEGRPKESRQHIKRRLKRWVDDYNRGIYIHA